MKSAVQYKTIKVTESVHRQLTEFVQIIHSKGWQHFGVERSCHATISSLIEAGLERFGKARASGKKR